MAQSPNSDVDRALATFSASPMQYRSFEDPHRAIADPNQTAPSALEFPLLCEALPEVVQFPIPAVIPAMPLEPLEFDRKGPSPASPDLKGTETSGAGTSTIRNANETQSDTVTLAGKETEATAKYPVRSLTSPIPQRDFMRQVPKRKMTAVLPGDGQMPRTALDAVFRTLRAAGPVREKPSAGPSGLQDIFSLL
jgi:hypothetical protein